MRLKYWFFIALGLFVIYLVNVFVGTMIMESRYEEKYDTIAVSELEPGDIIFMRSNLFSGFIPGYWSHSTIFVGFEDDIPYVVEAKSWYVVSRIPLSESSKRKLHVMVGKYKGDVELRKKAAEWAETKVGNPFDYYYPLKQEEGESYYCSEIIWAAYLSQGVDLDINPGFTIKYAWSVAPQEMFDNEDIELFNLEGY